METQMDSHMNPNALKWELQYLRVKCRDLDVEECVHLYDKRLNITNCSILMLLLTIILIIEAHVMTYTNDFYSITYQCFIIYFTALIIVLLLLSLNYKNVVLTEGKFNIRFLVNALAALVWLLKGALYFYAIISMNMISNLTISLYILIDICAILIHGKQVQAFIMRIDCFVMILLVYLLFPFNNTREMFFIAMIVSTVDLVTHYNYLKLYTGNCYHKDFHLVIEVIFKLYVHCLCIYFRMCRESVIRVSILNRRQLIEEELYLNLINEREKMIMNSILPAEIGHSLQEDLRNRIKTHKLETPSRSLFVEPHSEVTILNADVVQFTKLATTIKVGVLVQILHDIFVKFDTAADDHSVLRVKFLGDCYNCVAGIPYPIAIHANCCVDLGLKMINLVDEVGSKYEQQIEIRVGVHSGQVLSGVIGINKWNFDIWSRDVEIAIRLEQKGRAGLVHISQDTFNLLEEDEYFYEENTEDTGIDSILKTHNLRSYFIKDLMHPEQGYPSVNIVVTEPSIFSFATTDDYIEDCNYDISDVKKISSSRLYEYVIQMPIAQTGVTTIFDFSKKHDVKTEDIEFKNYITQFWLLLDTSNEINFQNEPSLLFKYAIVLVTILGYIIVLQSSRNTTFNKNIPYYACPIILMTVFCFVIMYKKLWTMFWAKSILDQPSNSFQSRLYKASQIIEINFISRVIVYMFYMGCLTTLCLFQLENCEKKLYELEAIEADLYDLKPTIMCFEPEIFTTSVIYTLISSYMIVSIPFFVKSIISAMICTIYFIVILCQYDLIFQRDGTTYTSIRSEHSHILYVLSAFLVLHVKERKITYIDKLNYLVKKDILHAQRKVKVSKKSVKILMQNILPPHIAEKYFINRRGAELFSEEFSKIAVMFASIKNYDPDKNSIRVLNDIICSFDDLLNKYKGHIEKIKVSNWSYMAVSGLEGNYDPTKRDTMMSSQSVVRFSTKTENTDYQYDTFVGEILNRKKRYYIEDNDAVVLLLTSFGLDLLGIMKEIIEGNIFLSLELGKPIALQIGISHGPVMAGIVGNPRPHYDIWGNPVNMASRMDSNGLPGMIQISEKTAHVLRGYNIRCDYRRLVYCKGFGNIPTYFVAIDENGNFIEDENQSSDDALSQQSTL